MTNKDFIFKVPSFLKFTDELKDNDLAITVTESEFISDQIAEMNKVSIYGDRDNSIEFFNEFISVIDKSGKGQKIQKGTSGIDETELLETLDSLKENCELTCLEAYLREAIKQFNKLKTDLGNYSKSDYMKLKGYPFDKSSTGEDYPSFDDIINSEDLGTIADYIKFQTYASYYGNRVLHRDGVLSTARVRLRDKLKNSNELEEIGTQLILTEYEPTISKEKLDEIFFKIQGIQRDYQVKYNSLKRKLDNKLNQKTRDVIDLNQKATDEYLSRMNKINDEFTAWKLDQGKLLGNLKIVIPFDFVNTYNNIKSKLNR